MVAMTLYLTFCGGLSAGGGFYVECKKQAWRAAGAGKWTGYEGVAAERSNARSRGIKNDRRRSRKRRAPYIYS